MKTLTNIENVLIAAFAVIATVLTGIIFFTALHGLINDPTSIVYTLLNK